MATAKEYNAVAKAINAQRHRTGTGSGLVRVALDALAEDLAVWYARDNPRFDSARFIAACGVK